MGTGSWVILEAGGFAATALAAAAWLFGSQGVEFASWFAGVSGVLVILGAFFLAHDMTRHDTVRPHDTARPHGIAPPHDPARPHELTIRHDLTTRPGRMT